VRGREATLRGEVQAHAGRDEPRLTRAQKRHCLNEQFAASFGSLRGERPDSKIRFLEANPGLMPEGSRSVQSNRQATTKSDVASASTD
jgi:hypothetical protein